MYRIGSPSGAAAARRSTGLRPQLQLRCQPRHHQPTKDVVDLLRQQLGRVVQPPGQNGHEGAGDVLRRETALLGRALEAKALEVQGREIGDYLVNALQHEAAARPAHDRAVERQMSAGMLQHCETEAKTSRA